MKINKKTRVKDILPLLSWGDRVERLIEIIPEYPLRMKRFSGVLKFLPVWKNVTVIGMTIGEFSFAVLSEKKFIEGLLTPRERVYKAFGRVKSFRKQMEELQELLERFSVPQGKDEKQAAIGVFFPNFLQRMLLTVTEYFHLHSFAEAEKITIAEYLLILQEQSSSAIYQRNYHKIIERNNKINNGKRK